jgi:tRNA A-37 threonylcarbamoyl transferase component Bud32
VSRVDTLTDEFSQLLSRRPYVVGDVIAGRYRLAGILGEGAMGQVFVAENLSIGRRVAIKMLRPELLADAVFRRRFQKEAEAIAAIEHRNVVRFFDLVVGDPTFLVMEYVEGPTLAQVLRQEKRLEVGRALDVARRLAWALDAAHGAGVIHRDVKPSNVLLASDVELGEDPRLIDFGLAKLAVGVDDPLTKAGQIVGTPHYMAPEQIANKDIDQRSDVYSLGCVLYHMIAGNPPFGGTDDLQILYQQVHREAAPLRANAPNLPAELEALLQKALAKDPARRIATMRELAEALDGFVRSADGVRRRVEPQPGQRRPQRAQSLWRLLTLTALLACAAAAGGLVLGARHRAAARPAGGALIVTSDPADATVKLDGRALAETTPTVAAGVPAGTHRLQLERAGHAPVEQFVTVRAGERLAVAMTLPQKTRSFTVRTVPAGALVYVDDRLILGETPLAIDLTDDDFHQLRIEKAGFALVTRNVKPEDRVPALDVTLEPEKQALGTLWVDANRAAPVFIDGNDTGLVTPTLGIRVAPGEHTVELRDGSGAVRAASTVKIAKGEALHTTLDFATGSK